MFNDVALTADGGFYTTEMYNIMTPSNRLPQQASRVRIQVLFGTGLPIADSRQFQGHQEASLTVS